MSKEKPPWRRSTWVTEDGNELELWQMNTYHLCNTLAMLERKGAISLEKVTQIFAFKPLSMESQAGLDYQRACSEAARKHSPMVDYIKKELKLRGKLDVYEKHYQPSS